MSLNPSLLPAIEKDWQGNPAHKISKSGKSSVLIVLMSLKNNSFSVLKYVLYNKFAYLSISQEPIHLNGYNFCSLGTRYVEGSSSYDIFQGSIYLKDSYIKLNTKFWWQGITPERIIL